MPEATTISQEVYRQNYLANIYLYEGMANEVFTVNNMGHLLSSNTSKNGFGKNDDKRLYPQKNIFKVITDTFVNLSLFEFPDFNFEEEANQDFFSDWAKSNKFEEKLERMLKKASITGDCLAILYEKNDSWKVKTINNDNWTPEYDDYDIQEEALINHLDYEYVIEKTTYKVRKTYNYNDVENKTTISYTVKDQQGGSEMPEELKEKLGIEGDTLEDTVDGKIFFRLKNDDSLLSYYGLSDYTENIKGLGELINFLLELQIYVQIKTGNPPLAVPVSLLDSITEKVNNIIEKGDITAYSSLKNDKNYGSLGQQVKLRQLLESLNVFPVSVNPMTGEKENPEFIQAQSTIGQIEISINRLLEIVEQDTALPTILFNKDIGIGNLSGSAIQRLMQKTLHKKHTKEIKIKAFLQDVFFNILLLSGLNPEIPSISFYDGVVDSRLEQLQEIELMLNNGLITKQKAIEMIYKIGTKEAEAMLEEINTEKGDIPYNEGMPSLSENLTQEEDDNQSRD